MIETIDRPLDEMSVPRADDPRLRAWIAFLRAYAAVTRRLEAELHAARGTDISARGRSMVSVITGSYVVGPDRGTPIRGWCFSRTCGCMRNYNVIWLRSQLQTGRAHAQPTTWIRGCLLYTWQLDTAHTTVSFTAKHMMITKTRGIFKGVTGTIDFNEANPSASSVSVVMQAATIETGMEARDNHLRSADFLDAEKFPTLTFTSTS